jgi:hypothetical protein
VLSVLGGLKLFFDVLVWVLDWKSRVDEAVETAGQVGPGLSMVLNAVMSPWFGVALILLGVFYLVFVPAESHPAETHPAIGVRVANIFPWAAAGVCTLLLWGAFVAGYVAVNLSHSRRIMEKEKVAMAEELKAAGSFSLATIQLPDADFLYIADLMWILKKADWKVGYPLLEVWEEPLPGLNILVPASDEIPEEGITFVPKSGQIPAGAEALARVLVAHHIGFIIRTGRGQLHDTFSLLFGSRP